MGMLLFWCCSMLDGSDGSGSFSGIGESRLTEGSMGSWTMEKADGGEYCQRCTIRRLMGPPSPCGTMRRAGKGGERGERKVKGRRNGQHVCAGRYRPGDQSVQSPLALTVTVVCVVVKVLIVCEGAAG